MIIDPITAIAAIASVTAAFFAVCTYTIQKKSFNIAERDRIIDANPIFDVSGEVDRFEKTTIHFPVKIRNVAGQVATINKIEFTFYYDNPNDQLAYCTEFYDPNIAEIAIKSGDSPKVELLPINLKHIITPSRVTIFFHARYIDKYGEERMCHKKIRTIDITEYLSKIRNKK